MHVAQSPGRLLHIRLELKSRVAELLAPRRFHGRESFQKRGAVPADQTAKDFIFEAAGHISIAEKKPRIEESRIRFHLVFLEILEVCGMADLMTHLELQIPQRVQDGLDRILINFVFKEE